MTKKIETTKYSEITFGVITYSAAIIGCLLFILILVYQIINERNAKSREDIELANSISVIAELQMKQAVYFERSVRYAKLNENDESPQTIFQQTLTSFSNIAKLLNSEIEFSKNILVKRDKKNEEIGGRKELNRLIADFYLFKKMHESYENHANKIIPVLLKDGYRKDISTKIKHLEKEEKEIGYVLDNLLKDIKDLNTSDIQQIIAHEQIVIYLLVALIIIVLILSWILNRKIRKEFIAIFTTEKSLTKSITELKRSQAETLTYKTSMDEHSLVSKTDIKGNITYVNKKFCEVSGYSQTELIGSNHRLLNSDNKPKDYWRNMYLTTVKGNAWNDEVRNKAKDGHYYWVDTTIIPVYDENNKLDGYASIRTDITAHKTAQAEIITHKMAMDEHSLVSMTDIKGNITYVNDKFCKVSGYSQKELIGANHRLLNSENQTKNYWRDMYIMTGKGLAWNDEVRNKAKDGHFYWVDTTIIPVYDENNKLSGYTSIRTDISTQKAAQAKIISQKTAMDEHSLVSITDIKGTITYVNEKFCDVSGYSEEELLGANHRLLNSQNQPKDYWRDMYLATGKGNAWNDEVRNQAKDGHYYWVDTTIVPLYNDNNKLSGYTSIRTDISARKEQEQLLIAARTAAEEAAVAKMQFLATMSHEIRTPMNGVIGMTRLLEGTELTDEQKDYVDTITRSGNNLLSIINDILDFSKLNVEMVEIESIDFDIERVCQESLSLIMGNSIDKEHEFIFDFAPDCPRYFTGDPTRIRQILVNLLGNAVKFTHSGHIRLGVSYVNVDISNNQLRIEVEDTGIGLKDEAINHLFSEFTQADPTTTRKYGGTGLGLAITKKLVDLMGGEIGVNSEYNEGTTFWVTIQLPRVAAYQTTTINSLKGIKILFVDDYKENRVIFKRTLEHMGALVSTAKNSTEVLESIKRAKSSNAPYKIVMLDHNMPDKNGFEIGVIIRAHKDLNDLKMVMLTSVGQREDIALYKLAGFNAYLNKLFLYETLNKVLLATLKHQTGEEIISEQSILNSNKSSLEIQPIFNASVLLVEDVIVNQIIAKAFLSNMGLNVDIAKDGQEAIDICDKKSYDIIFMDCLMPVMDGYEATKIIRMKEKNNNKSRTPIIALTANASTDDRILCEQAGMDEVITKPFEPADLSSCLRKWLEDTNISQ